MIKTVTIPAFKRPDALSILLKSLRSNDLDGWKVIIRIEPSNRVQDCIEAINSCLHGCDYLINVNPKVNGVRKNTFEVVSSAFELGSSLNVYLEEDLVVSPDILNMADWYQQHCSEDLLCLNYLIRISGSSACFSTSRYPSSLVKTRSFNSLGIVITKEQWEKYFKANWLTRPNGMLTYVGHEADGWDFAIYNFLLENPNLHVLHPLHARANHVGGSGTYCTEAYQDQSFSYVEINTESYNDYQIISEEKLQGSEKGFFILMNEMNLCMKTLKEVESQRRQVLNINLAKLVLESGKQKIRGFQSSAEVQAIKGKIKSNSIVKRCLGLIKKTKHN